MLLLEKEELMDGTVALKDLHVELLGEVNPFPFYLYHIVSFHTFTCSSFCISDIQKTHTAFILKMLKRSKHVLKIKI